jgi:DNA-binding winged helix-turn-helix (wHTH) protein
MSSTRKVNRDRSNVVRYSDMEQELLKLLQKKGAKPIASTDLLKEYYKDKIAPYNAQQTLIGSLRSLRRKVAHNGEQFQIKNTKRRGPHAMEFWVERPGK